jgi:galactofuranose transport system permease protein
MSAWKKLLRDPQRISFAATLATLALLIVGGGLRYQGFLAPGVLVNLLDDGAFLGIAAIGMTFVILSGGIDLSVGSVVGFTSILVAKLVEGQHWPPAAAIALALALGAGFGALMGAIIQYGGLAPFLVTLAGMFLARGLGFVLSLESIQMANPLYAQVSSIRLPVGGGASLPAMALVFLGWLALAAFIASATAFGRDIYAIGGSEPSARLMGLPVARTRVLTYAFSGLSAALAGVVYGFYTSSGNASAATGLELDAIAAVVIGGTLLSGGSGTVAGTLVGVLILGIIQTAISFEDGLSSWWARITIGALLFAFVAIQRVAARRFQAHA